MAFFALSRCRKGRVYVVCSKDPKHKQVSSSPFAVSLALLIFLSVKDRSQPSFVPYHHAIFAHLAGLKAVHAFRSGAHTARPDVKRSTRQA